MSRNTTSSHLGQLNSRSTPLTTRSGGFSQSGYKSFSGYDTRHLQMASFVLHVYCLVVLVSTVSSSQHLFVTGKMLLVLPVVLSTSRSHLQCLEQAVTFIAVMDKKQPSIQSQLSDSYDSQVQQNSNALLSIVDIIQFLIKQGLALRGHT